MSLTSLSPGLEISISEAIQVHGRKDVAFIDGTWWLGNRKPTSREAFEQGPRIKGAHFLDIDDIATKGDPLNLPHMMPSQELTASYMSYCGIRNSDHVIVYGQEGCPYIHRAWYQLYAMGHEIDRLRILDGSIRDWEKEGGPIETGRTSAVKAKDLDLSKPADYVPCSPRGVYNIKQMREIIETQSPGKLIVDARSPDRFYARVDEPRPGLRKGHMPDAVNVFFQDLLDEKQPLRLKSVEELKATFYEQGIEPSQDGIVVISCGSGATACTIAAALVKCGRDASGLAIYDGSWAEWGAMQDTPIV